ncbi:serine/threonine-protein kinase ATG1a isoform X2 [Asparagus officinalis]|uniref:serine/threonine-protein kinase ATG1a isoform X2 n=1 Tax=Asparagus officinalis TaxID=4686 RepID=UPI00098E0828|nr:serine/threonine-protein kinase ATG1a isoform X2 [Asparagus officinalis]
MATEEIGPHVVGDYIVGPQKVGFGSFSVVLKGRHRLSGAEVAVKEIDKRRLSSKVKESLLKEIAILRQVSHPNIVRLHQAIQTEDKIYLILEYCPGGDLGVYIHRHGKVSESVARHFMTQLASGLQVLRENNLIHRDLKPQNLLLCTKDETPVLKIGDFGFARYLMPQGLADTLCGSPLYMAPEIIQNKKYDAKADLWSVGAILFQLVTGKPPFDGNTQFQLFQNVLASDELQFPHDVMATLHPDCIDLCKRLLRQNPVERLTFEEFFNHKFMTMLSPSGSAAECTQNTTNYKVGKLSGESLNSANAQSMKKEDTEQGLLPATSTISDSFESIEREYVLVRSHFASMETSSLFFEASLRDNSTASLMESSKLVSSAVCGAESVGSQNSASIVSQTSTASVDVAGPLSLNPSSRLKFLYSYLYILAEVAQAKLNSGLHLDSFSVELVALAVWKEALQVCNLWMASTSVADPFNSFSSNNCLSQQKDDRLPQNLSEGLDFNRPLSVYSWLERGFILACDRAEKISHSFCGNLEMPDAMEIIFQTALSLGKGGAVEELMGHRNRAVASYSKAITLLTFILVEASSLSLNPPFTLSSTDQRRIQRYIINLRVHLKHSQIAESHVKLPQGSLRK